MNSLICLVAFLAIFVNVADSQSFTCPNINDGYFVDPDDCRKFIRCNGGAIIDRGQCADNLFFDPIEATCNFNVRPGVVCTVVPGSPTMGPFVEGPGCHLRAVPNQPTQFYKFTNPTEIFDCSNDLIFNEGLCTCTFILTPNGTICPLMPVMSNPSQYFHISEPTIIRDCANSFNQLVFKAPNCGCTFVNSDIIDVTKCILRPVPNEPAKFINLLDPNRIFDCPSTLVFNKAECGCNRFAVAPPARPCALIALPNIDERSFAPRYSPKTVLRCAVGRFSQERCNCVH